MPSSRRLIANSTLTGTTASVTFSSIPSAFTDLVLKWSTRDNGDTTYANITINGVSSANYSRIYIEATGTSVASGIGQNLTTAVVSGASTKGLSWTANTFSSGELYIPNYTSTVNKQFSIYTVAENNATGVGNNLIDPHASLFQSSSAISSITFAGNGNFEAGSSFYLYGIVNS